MHNALATLLNRLDSPAVEGTDVIAWGCPIPVFGDLSNSKIATLGLNPSSKEFIDDSGNELDGLARRFHTLSSLNLRSWSEVDARHLRAILESWQQYFSANPYDRWFKRLDEIVLGAGASYYDRGSGACHLDLVPFATKQKWGLLAPTQRASLAAMSADVLGLLLRDSPIRVLILNGRSVVNQFQLTGMVRLQERTMPSWSLSRESGPDVMGIAYKGRVTAFSGTELRHEILVLGFNHNLQSSFGVTRKVICAIRKWIAKEAKGAMD